MHCAVSLSKTIISSPEPKALGELIGWDSNQRPSVHTFKHEYLLRPAGGS